MAGQPVVLGIITGVKGSSPQKLGAKALFYPDRKIKGTLGGGCLEAEAQRLALNSLKTGRAESFELVLDHDFGWDDGLICGGKVLGTVIPHAEKMGAAFWNELAKRETAKTWGVKNDFTIALAGPAAHGWIYTETITPPCEFWIAGSGHIAQAVAPLALQLDFAVTVLDDRPELANHEFFPKPVTLRTGDWSQLCQTPFPSSPAFGLIVPAQAQTRCARAGKLDPPAVSIPRHDRQQAKSADHNRAFREDKDRDRGGNGPRGVSRGPEDTVAKRDGDRR